MSSLVQAESLAARCAAEHEEADCTRSRALYREAADTWNALVVGRPGDASIDEWTVQRAQALLAGGSISEAGGIARQYLASGTDPEWRKAAAEVFVKSREQAIAAAGIEVRTTPPEPTGEPPDVHAIDLPLPLAYLRDARQRYLDVVPEAADTTAARRGYALENALVLFRYGHWPEARTALQAVFDSGCAGPGAWDGGATAWRALRDIASALGRFDAVAELGRALAAQSCDFGTTATLSCDDAPDDPRCLARTDAVSVRLRTGILLAQRAEHGRPAERAQLAIRAGEAFLASVDEDPDVLPMERVDGLTFAARAFRLAGSDRALEVDRRIATQVIPARFSAEERPRVAQALADALQRLMLLARDAGRHEDVVQLARRLLTADFDFPDLAAIRTTARATLPVSLTALTRHREAADAWTALAAAETDPAKQRSASFASAIALVTAGDCRRATVALRAFATAHRAEPGAGDEVVRALYRFAMCQRDASPARTAAIDDMTAAANATHDALSAEAKGYLAAAAFARADAGFGALSQRRIAIPRGANTDALAPALLEAMREPADELRQLIEQYDGVARLDDARWSIAAHHRAALALERFVETILAATWTDPADLEAQRRTLSQTYYDRFHGIVALRVRETLEAQARPVRCRAVERFDRAAAIASQTNVQSPEAEAARARLALLGEAVLTACRAQRRTAPR